MSRLEKQPVPFFRSSPAGNDHASGGCRGYSYLQMSRSAKRFFIVMLLGTLGVIGVVLFKLGPALLLAAVLATVLWPVQQWLSKKFRNRRSIAAGLLVFAVVTLIVTPVIGLSAVVVRQASEGWRYVAETLDEGGVRGLVEELPDPLRGIADKVVDLLPKKMKLQDTMGQQGGKAAAAVGGVVAATGSVLFQLAMMLIALFFFLVEGSAVLGWLDEASPLRKGQTRELLVEVRAVAKSVVLSAFATAGAQSSVALIGFLIARVPQPLFFTAVTFCFAMIPAIGAATIVCAAAALILLTGHTGMAIFLALWGVLAVGLIDNVVKPLLIKGKVEMNGAIVFFSLIGGIAAFGTIGLLIGPLVVALFLALLRMYHRDVSPRGRRLDKIDGGLAKGAARERKAAAREHHAT